MELSSVGVILFCATLSGLKIMPTLLSVGGAALTHGYYLSALQADDRNVWIAWSMGGVALTHGYYLPVFQAAGPRQPIL